MGAQERASSPQEQGLEQGRRQGTTTKNVKNGFTHTRAAKEADRLISKKYQEAKIKESEGKPVAWVMYGVPPEIMRCFDIIPVYPENYGSECARKKMTSPYIEYAEEDGFSTLVCGYLRVALGYARSVARGEPSEKAAFGGMARPSILLSASRLCDPRSKIFEAMRRYLDVPAFIIDVPRPPMEDPRCKDRKACEHYIQHMVEGYKGLVNFLEEQTGKKLDWDQLTEMLRNSVEMWHLFYSVQQLRKFSPCPLPSEDFFTVIWPYMNMRGEAEALEFYRNLHQEVLERIKSRVSVMPEEKFRILWSGQPAWFDLGLFNYLESLGAVSVMDTVFHPCQPRTVNVSDPLRSIAEIRFWGWDGGDSDGSQIKCGVAAGSHVLELAQDYSVDGVIMHSTISCRAVSIGARHTASVLREKMGLPVLYLESDMADPRSYSPTEEREKVDAFIHILEEKND